MLHSAAPAGEDTTMRHITLILTLFLVFGCGSKGSLYLPPKEEAEALSAAQLPEGESEQAAEKELDEEREDEDQYRPWEEDQP